MTNLSFPQSLKMSNLNVPKTLIVDLSTKYGGSTSRVLSLLSQFSNDHVALAALEDSAIAREAYKKGLPIRILGRRKVEPLILPRLIKLIHNERYQVLDSQNIQSKFYSNLACTLTKTALVSTIHSWYVNEHGRSSTRGRIYTTLELATNQALSLYITVSEKDRQSLISSGIDPKKIELIYNAVNIKDVPSTENDWLKKRLGLQTDALICTAVGRLVAIKGYDILIEAAKKACKEIPNLVFVLIGEGPMKETLEAQIHKAGLAGRVILAGFFERSEVLSAVTASSLFIMPSRYEGTPIALLEAALLGRPILASNAGGIPELVTHEEHALLVQPENPLALANGIIRLCQDRTLSNKLSYNAQNRVKVKFSVETQVLATLNAYRKAHLYSVSEK